MSLLTQSSLQGGCNEPDHGGFHLSTAKAIVAATARCVVEESEDEMGGKEGEMDSGREIQWDDVEPRRGVRHYGKTAWGLVPHPPDPVPNWQHCEWCQ